MGKPVTHPFKDAVADDIRKKGSKPASKKSKSSNY